MIYALKETYLDFIKYRMTIYYIDSRWVYSYYHRDSLHDMMAFNKTDPTHQYIITYGVK